MRERAGVEERRGGCETRRPGNLGKMREGSFIPPFRGDAGGAEGGG